MNSITWKSFLITLEQVNTSVVANMHTKSIQKQIFEYDIKK